MWSHLGMGTASAHILPTDVHGCHPKHLACVTVNSCDVTVIFLIRGNTNNYPHGVCLRDGWKSTSQFMSWDTLSNHPRQHKAV